MSILPLVIQDELLHCPNCGEASGVHVDKVSMVGRPRGEDGPTSYAEIHSTGSLSAPKKEPSVGVDVPVMTTTSVPAGRLGEGRQHRIVLEVRCELCDTVTAIIFTQHKGQTLVEAVKTP